MSPTTRVLAVLMLAVTIAASTAASAVVQAAVLSSLAVPDADGLLNIEPLRDLPGRGAVVFNESYPNYLFLRDRRYDAFTAVTCILPSTIGWDDGGDVRALRAARVTASFFPTVAAQLAAGRPFTEADDGPTPAPVVVISHRLWRQHFNGAAAAIGKSMRLAGVPHTVVGVMPVNFGLPAGNEVWLPLGNPTYISPTGRLFSVYARVRPGVSTAVVTGAMADLTRATLERDAVANRDYRYRARTLREAMVDTSGAAIWLVQAGALLLFVLAVSNVWSLFLTNVIERGHETALRRALGASASDIVWLLVRRSLGIVVPAGVLGAGLAWAVLPLVRQLHPTPVLGFLLSGARLDAGTLGAMIGMTILAVAAIALVPAWHACRHDAAEALGSATRSATLSRPAARWQRAMVLAQSAVTVVVLVTAVVSGVSFWKLVQIPDGFTAADRTVARVILSDAQYTTHASRVQFADRLTEAVGRSPDVAALAFVTTLPVSDGLWGGRFLLQLPDGSIAQEPITLHNRRVSVNYLETMQIPLLRGRQFTAHDDANAPPVAILSRAAAERMWPGADPIGKRVHRFAPTPATAPPLEVVGVAGNTMDAGYASPVGETIYVPFAQQSVARLSIVIRPRGSEAAALLAIRNAVKTADPAAAASDLAPLQALVDDARTIPRLQMMLLAAFAVIAIGLTALGTYGVMSQSVASRRRELAIRLAVGATPRRVGGMVLGEHARLALAGIALGLAASWQISGLIAPLVFGISATSPVALATVGVTTLVATSAATIVPALRAAFVDVTKGIRN